MNSLKPFVISSIIILLLTGCQFEPSADTSAALPEVAQGSDEFEESKETTPAFPEPRAESDQGPLTGILRIPNVQIIPARQTQEELAQFLNTTPEMLRYVNPRLPDPVPPGTLVVHPTIFRLGKLGSVGDVSDETGLAVSVLLAANPSITEDSVLEEGTILTVPQLYIVPEDTPLSAAALALGTDHETLLSADPALQADEDDKISAGWVLVVPPTASQEE